MSKFSPDSFDFKAQEDDEPTLVGMLLPAVQTATMDDGGVDDFSGGEAEEVMVGMLLPAVQAAPEGRRSTSDDDHDGWIPILSMSQPIYRDVDAVDDFIF